VTQVDDSSTRTHAGSGLRAVHIKGLVTPGFLLSSPRTPLLFPVLQVDDSSTRTHAGSGLGLYIVKGLVTLMGGVQWQRRKAPGHLCGSTSACPASRRLGGGGGGMHGSPMGGSAMVPR